ncbi:hypothetical protein Taro_039698 [Colocasia esculenta]|uniref:Uncharacterized protein n=1 Tax=Colocasia esculenta TaxID=4460 RepID=A0A843WJN3_COLES|nr:hypothetical protein [Colocasia esculenta]
MGCPIFSKSSPSRSTSKCRKILLILCSNNPKAFGMNIYRVDQAVCNDPENPTLGPSQGLDFHGRRPRIWGLRRAITQV